MKIKRIDSYEDKRFNQGILYQHGAFIVDDVYKCSFKIVDSDSAIVFYDSHIDVDVLIDEFRFYSGHILNFYNEAFKLIKTFTAVDIFYLDIDDIQPSQFFVDEDKVFAIKSFIKNQDDICISVTKFNEEFVSKDGHTRLYHAVKYGYTRVKAYLTEPGDCLEDFVEEAKKRNVFTPHDLKLVCHEDFELKWNQFCDEVFEVK